VRPSIVVSRGSSSSCDLRRLASLARQEYLQSRERQAQAERWLQLAAECCLDLAHHLIAERGWATPSTYREAFQTLRSEGVLDADLAGGRGCATSSSTSISTSITSASTTS
jgi:hypothetical protein